MYLFYGTILLKRKAFFFGVYCVLLKCHTLFVEYFVVVSCLCRTGCTHCASGLHSCVYFPFLLLTKPTDNYGILQLSHSV